MEFPTGPEVLFSISVTFLAVLGFGVLYSVLYNSIGRYLKRIASALEKANGIPHPKDEKPE